MREQARYTHEWLHFGKQPSYTENYVYFGVAQELVLHLHYSLPRYPKMCCSSTLVLTDGTRPIPSLKECGKKVTGVANIFIVYLVLGKGNQVILQASPCMYIIILWIVYMEFMSVHVYNYTVARQNGCDTQLRPF